MGLEQTIHKISAWEILDSRGRPTIKACCELNNGQKGFASVPSGASRGLHEAHELRDGDPKRFNGLGVLNVVENVNSKINSKLTGQSVSSQEEFDQLLIELDGSPQKTVLGANAILAASISFARASASDRPLYQYFSEITNSTLNHLPRPTINLFSGGLHGGGQVPIQDLLIVPAQSDMMECMNTVYKIYQSAADLCLDQYGTRALSADEGGLAPPFPSLNSIFELALKSIEKTGYQPGKDAFIALDVAASHFYVDGKYQLLDEQLDGNEMVEKIHEWCKNYPIVSVEDGLAEEDWQYWPQLREKLDDNILVLGDDLLCTNTSRIERAINSNAASALLLKVNQIGTLSEAAQAHQMSRKAGWQITVSARSGETEDDWLADLAVGWQGNQIKIGSITQSERLAKYNRLIEIEKETGLAMNPWPN